MARHTERGVYHATSSALSVACGRLSYSFGLRGPSVSVDTGGQGGDPLLCAVALHLIWMPEGDVPTAQLPWHIHHSNLPCLSLPAACSASLVGLHMAARGLQAGEALLSYAAGKSAWVAWVSALLGAGSTRTAHFFPVVPLPRLPPLPPSSLHPPLPASLPPQACTSRPPLHPPLTCGPPACCLPTADAARWMPPLMATCAVKPSSQPHSQLLMWQLQLALVPRARLCSSAAAPSTRTGAAAA